MGQPKAASTGDIHRTGLRGGSLATYTDGSSQRPCADGVARSLQHARHEASGGGADLITA